MLVQKNMASGGRLHVYTNIINRCKNFKCFRIAKVVNNGIYNVAANCSTSALPAPSDTKGSEVEEPMVQKRYHKAVEAYLKRAQEDDNFLKEQLVEYEKGKKFLARIMGENIKKFNQKDVDEAISYLFPSALYQPLARPMLKHPTDLFAKRKEAQFDKTGRPHHYLFYTNKPNFTHALHECALHLENLNKKIQNMDPNIKHPENVLKLEESVWKTKQQLESQFLEKLLDVEYEKFIEAMDRLITHPYSYQCASFIQKFREKKAGMSFNFIMPKKTEIEEGVFAVEINRCKRKKCTGRVKVINPGTGKLIINRKSLIDFFDDLPQRQEVIFPLIFTDMLGKVDVLAKVVGKGPSSQAFVVRYGISLGLLPFVDESTAMKMKVAGLLQKDPRCRERDKPGQRGARRRYTWLKR